MATKRPAKTTKKKTTPKPIHRQPLKAGPWEQPNIDDLFTRRMFRGSPDEAAAIKPIGKGWLWRIWPKPGDVEEYISGTSNESRVRVMELVDQRLTALGIQHNGERWVQIPTTLIDAPAPKPEPAEKSLPAGPWYETGPLGTASCRFFNAPGLIVAASVEFSQTGWRWSVRRSSGWGASSPIIGGMTRAEAMAGADAALTEFGVEHDNVRPTSEFSLDAKRQPSVLEWTPVMFDGLEGVACEKWHRHFLANQASVAAEIWFHKGAWLWTAWGVGPNARIDGSAEQAAVAMEKADEALLSLGIRLDAMFSVRGRPLPAPPIGLWTSRQSGEASCRMRLDDSKYAAAMVEPMADGRWEWKVFLSDHQCPATGIAVDRYDAQRAADHALRVVGYVVDPQSGPSVYYIDRDAPPPPPQTSIPYVDRYTARLRTFSGEMPFAERMTRVLKDPFGEWTLSMDEVRIGKDASGATKVLATAKGRPEVKAIAWCDDDEARHRLVAAVLAAVDPFASMPTLTVGMYAKDPQERERHLVEYKTRVDDPKMSGTLEERIDQVLLEPFGEWILQVSGVSQRFQGRATARAPNGHLVDVRGDCRDAQQRERLLIMVLAAIGTLPPTKDAPKPVKAPESAALIEKNDGAIVTSVDGVRTWILEPKASPWALVGKLPHVKRWIRGHEGRDLIFARVTERADGGGWSWKTFGRNGYRSGPNGVSGLTGEGSCETLLDAMKAADESLSLDGVAHDRVYPIDATDASELANRPAPDAPATPPQTPPAAPATATERRALIASVWRP